LSATHLYGAYRAWIEENGCRPMAAQQFTREVQRTFPTARRSPHPKTVGGKRVRVWGGLEMI
jgi:hypothetical protein